MADDGIRLPRDSTVASQKVHRGSGLPENQLTLPNPKVSVRPTPLLTIVLKSTPLLKGQKQSLFDLLVQNDPKSEAPIRLTSDTDLKPGTSLLLTLNKEGEYQPIEKPNPEQLRQLIKLELEFWRAHLIPQANLKDPLTLPTSNQLKNLATRIPLLEPLIKTLFQQPTQISSRQVEQWLNQFQTMTTVFQTRNSTEKTEPLLRPKQLAPSQIQTNPMPSKPVLLEKPFIIPDFRLNNPVGLQSKPITLDLLSQFIKSQAHPEQLIVSRQAPQPKISFTDQLFRVVLPAEPERQIRLVNHRHRLTFIRPPVPQDQSVQQGSTSANKVKSSVTNSAQFNTLIKPVLITVNDDKPAKQTMTADNPNTVKTHSRSDKPILPIPWPTISNRSVELPSGQRILRDRLPVEFRLSAWLSVLDNEIAILPSALRSQMQQQAEILLKKSQIPPVIENSGQNLKTKNTSSVTDEFDSALLQLRNALETSLARLQHASIQTALQQWTAPDQPVQHLHLPLIWLGLTHWADIEWWQEKKQKEKPKDSTQESIKAFKMRIFLCLAPLSEFCAELERKKNVTSLTFWSEDQATLGHLYNLLPTLEQWTQGLGEHHLQTKHGLPRRKTQVAESATDQHLVDIRT